MEQQNYQVDEFNRANPITQQPGYAAQPYGAPGYGAPMEGYGAPMQAPGYNQGGAQGYPPPMAGGAPGYPPPMMGGAPPMTSGPPLAPAQPPPGCPPGLQYLTMLDQLVVKQKVELLEAFTGFETANKYKVYNSLGQEVYNAKEDTDCCTRQCCGPIRPFMLNITDGQGQEVITLDRPLRCQACCFPCCLQELEVMSPPGTVIGTVEQQWSIIYPRFVIKDEAGNPVLKIEGPFLTCSCCNDVEFKVLSYETGTEVGMITKQWTGLIKEAYTDADNFGITFPLDLDVKMKATLLGALFLIDFMYFETQNQNNHNN